jgi:2-deoxy-D-gluconate 3-dehydrogenase
MDDIFSKFSLKGQTAVVTGGAGLLGKEFCRTLSQAGASVIVSDLDKKLAADVANEINFRRRECHSVWR